MNEDEDPPNWSLEPYFLSDSIKRLVKHNVQTSPVSEKYGDLIKCWKSGKEQLGCMILVLASVHRTDELFMFCVGSWSKMCKEAC